MTDGWGEGISLLTASFVHSLGWTTRGSYSSWKRRSTRFGRAWKAMQTSAVRYVSLFALLEPPVLLVRSVFA